MKFSLVLPTIGRTREISRFLASLDAQTYRNFELVIIDQNPDESLVDVLAPYSKRFPFLHLRSERGLSRARNIGLKNIDGDIVAFPDDDCWYPENLLEQVNRWFKDNPELDGLTGLAEDGEAEVSVTRWGPNACLIDRLGVWRKCTSITIFLRKSVIDQTRRFDETLGAGSGTPWGSAEEMDYLIDLLDCGYRIYYNPCFVVYHPQSVQTYDAKSIERGYSYGAGMGRVLRKHRFPLWFVAYLLIRPLGGALLSFAGFNIAKARYHWSIFRGRLSGWLS